MEPRLSCSDRRPKLGPRYSSLGTKHKNTPASEGRRVFSVVPPLVRRPPFRLCIQRLGYNRHPCLSPRGRPHCRLYRASPGSLSSAPHSGTPRFGLPARGRRSAARSPATGSQPVAHPLCPVRVPPTPPGQRLEVVGCGAIVRPPPGYVNRRSRRVRRHPPRLIMTHGVISSPEASPPVRGPPSGARETTRGAAGPWRTETPYPGRIPLVLSSR